MKKPTATRSSKPRTRPMLLDVQQTTEVSGGGWFNDWLWNTPKNSHPDAK